MNFSNITVVIDRGKDEIRAGKIKAQLASGILKFDPDSDLPPPPPPEAKVRSDKVTIEAKLKIVLGFAEFKGTFQAFAKTMHRSASFVFTCKNEYLAGHLGDIDEAIAEKLTDRKAIERAKEYLEIVLELAEFNGTLQAFAKTIYRSYSFVFAGKKEYLAGHLGDIDKNVAKKLRGGK